MTSCEDAFTFTCFELVENADWLMSNKLNQTKTKSFPINNVLLLNLTAENAVTEVISLVGDFKYPLPT